MPFDTTYHIPAGENKVDIKYTALVGRIRIFTYNLANYRQA